MFIMDAFLHVFSDIEIYWATSLVRILLSFFAGFILGLERKIHKQLAGLRMHILISVSSTLIMLLSIYMSQRFSAQGTADPSRIAAQVVSGIGFLGGGAILRQGFNIKGLTTAATIWSSAGIGLAIGAGMIAAPLIALACILCMLFIMEYVEDTHFPADRNKILHLVYHNEYIDFDFLQKEIERYGLFILSMNVSKKIDTKKLCIKVLVKTPNHIDIQNLTTSMMSIGKLDTFKLTD